MAQPPGFVLPPLDSKSPGYPPYPQQGGGPPAYQPNHQPFPAPIQHQPTFGYQPSAQWFANTDFQGYLMNATSFHVKQKVELLEILAGWETENQYTVKDQDGHKLLYVGEQSGCLGRQFCGAHRPFHLSVKDSRGLNVLTYDRDLDCSMFCGLLCPDRLTVSAGGGQILGYVDEEFHIITPSFALKNAAGQTVLRIEGPACPCALNCGDVVFRVMTPEGVSVGTISKQWGGLVRELFTDADYFAISFPVNLDPSMKAVCLGALFLIDFEYFEAGGGGNQGGRRLFG